VKFHVSNIFHKIGVESRVEAVKQALEQKLV
jgi:DNA-binding CsgD family transcriptional regulator